MKNANSTALKIPSWYIEFLAALLRQAPQLEEIDQVTAEGWINNQKSLKNKLTGCLIYPPMTTKSPESNSLLKFVGTITIPATTEKFVAKSKFVVNTEHNTLVRISYLSEKFIKFFLSGEGKVEDPIIKHTLHYAKLRESSLNDLIIAELGGEEKAETTLSEVFSSMENQNNKLLLNGGCFERLFFSKDMTGVLRVIFVYHYARGCAISAHDVNSLRAGGGSYHVFYRNPVLESP